MNHILHERATLAAMRIVEAFGLTAEDIPLLTQLIEHEMIAARDELQPS